MFRSFFDNFLAFLLVQDRISFLGVRKIFIGLVILIIIILNILLVQNNVQSKSVSAELVKHKNDFVNMMHRKNEFLFFNFVLNFQLPTLCEHNFVIDLVLVIILENLELVIINLCLFPAEDLLLDLFLLVDFFRVTIFSTIFTGAHIDAMLSVSQ